MSCVGEGMNGFLSERWADCEIKAMKVELRYSQERPEICFTEQGQCQVKLIKRVWVRGHLPYL